MKEIKIDDELYQYIASRTQSIGESASDILRRLLRLPASPQPFVLVQENMKSEKVATPVKSSEPAQIVAKVEAVLKSADFTNESKGVVRFLQLLSTLYRANPSLFAKVCEQIGGSGRVYFAKDESSILQAGSGVKAKQIPDSPYWVITNNNTARKGIILTALMDAMGLPQALIERVKQQFN